MKGKKGPQFEQIEDHTAMVTDQKWDPTHKDERLYLVNFKMQSSGVLRTSHAAQIFFE